MAILRFDGASRHDAAVAAWMERHAHTELGEAARHWFAVMRGAGDEVLELFHDGCPVACFGDAPFASVNIYTAHMNLAFFQGASLPDPDRLLEGSGRFMRHVKIRAGGKAPVNALALAKLIQCAFEDIKARVERGE